jgi:hypothetical protein
MIPSAEQHVPQDLERFRTPGLDARPVNRGRHDIHVQSRLIRPTVLPRPERSPPAHQRRMRQLFASASCAMLLEMPVQVARRAERLGASGDFAGVRSRRVVLLQVLRELCLTQEGPRAAIARTPHERQGPMEPHMPREVAGCGESSSASGCPARMRSVSRVCLHVLRERVLAVESALAVVEGAAEGLVIFASSWARTPRALGAATRLRRRERHCGPGLAG